MDRESSPAAAADLRGPAMGGVVGLFLWEQAGHILLRPRAAVQPHCCWKLQAAGFSDLAQRQKRRCRTAVP